MEFAQFILATLLFTSGFAGNTSMVHVEKRNRLTSLRSKNRGYFTASLRKDQNGLYYTSVAVGAFKKRLQLLFDTTLTDVIIPATVSSIPNTKKFQHTLSPTYMFLQSPFNLQYPNIESNNVLTGEWGADSFDFNGNVIGNVRMPLDLSGKLQQGVLGLGSMTSTRGPGSNSASYNSLLQSMKKQGYIRKLLYSVNVGEGNTGSLIFGGIDKHAYTGTLQYVETFSNIPSEELESQTAPDIFYSNLFVNIDSILYQNTAITACSQIATINTRSSVTTVPERIFNELGQWFGSYAPDLAAYEIDCKSTTGNDFEFNFSNQKIIVKYKNIVVPVKDSNGNKRCILGIKASPDDYISLGTSFLKNAYIVFNMEDRLLGLAQSKYSYIPNIVVAS